MNKNVYEMVNEFIKKYPMTIAWRVKKHSKVVEKFLNPDEEVKFAFAAQKNDSTNDIFNTYVVALTNKRIILGRKRLFFGFFYTTITPDMFNDLTVKMGIVWGKIYIDTVKELVILSNIDPKALDSIETNITEYMMNEKKKYVSNVN
ncbi:MAG: PH domain-containing protein [Bacilli bacterium]|nr:PH domain-containing protein [Bacilli bacterium]